MRLSAALAICVLGASSARAAADLSKTDARLALRYRHGLERVSEYADANPQVFARKASDAAWLEEDRDLALRAWTSALDYLLALDAIVRRSEGPWVSSAPAASDRTQAVAGFTAWAGTYGWFLDWSARCDRDPSLVRLLDRPVPALGVPAGSYARLKSLLDAQRRRGLFDVGYARYLGWKGDGALRKALGPLDASELLGRVKKDVRRLRLRGARKTARRVRPVSWLEGWSPDLRVPSAAWSAPASTVCDPEPLQDFEDKLRPGDVVLIRSEPFAGDVGAPGWWNSAALHVGTSRDVRRVLGQPDRSRPSWWRRAVAFALEPSTAAVCPARFLAVGERGAFLATMQELAAVGPLAVLRPRLPEDRKVAALRRALSYAVRIPRDGSNEDWTGAWLIARAYENQGWTPPAATALGREAESADDIAESFDARFGLDAQQLDLVWFLDEGGSVSSVEEFRRTWRRPKWDLARNRGTRRQS